MDRNGFLPIKTNMFDRFFIATVVFIAINLFWMRFIESLAPLWIATIGSLILGQWIVRKG